MRAAEVGTEAVGQAEAVEAYLAVADAVRGCLDLCDSALKRGSVRLAVGDLLGILEDMAPELLQLKSFRSQK
jgi:hypothetical protein